MKETEINRLLTEFDERFETVEAEGWEPLYHPLNENDRRFTVKPNYCSEDSPRDLISGIENQLSPDQLETYFYNLTEAVKPKIWRGMWACILATSKERARALAEVIGEKE